MITSTPARIADNRTLLTGIRWQTYEELLLDLAENPSKRLTYDQGLLEIMTPLPEHEASKRLLGRLVESTTEELGLEIYSLGSTTWRREDLQKGLEPDECYYITQEAQVRGKTKFDLYSDPAPDLAIEIDLTSSSLNRLGIYAALGVREIWRYDGQDLKIYVLVEGDYQQQERSSILPVLSRPDILLFLNKKSTLGENSLIREFRQWLHQQG